MRRLLILIGLLLTACSHYEPPALHGAASMRVEVEVYKGPLTVSPAGQVGQLVAEVSDSIRAVDHWQDRAVTLRSKECAGGAKDSPDCRQLRNAMSSANAILGAGCYLLKSPTLMETVGRGVYVPVTTCGGLPRPSATAFDRAETELTAAKKVAVDKQAAYAAADLQAAQDREAERRAFEAMLDARDAADEAADVALLARGRTGTAHRIATDAKARSDAAARALEEKTKAYENLVKAEKTKPSAAALTNAARAMDSAREDYRRKNRERRDAELMFADAEQAEARAPNDKVAADQRLVAATTTYEAAAKSAAASAAAVNKPKIEMAEANRVVSVKTAARSSAEAKDESEEADEEQRAKAQADRRAEALTACQANLASQPGACDAAVTNAFGRSLSSSAPEKVREDARLASFKHCLKESPASPNAPAECQAAALREFGPPGGGRPDSNYLETKYRSELDAAIQACIRKTPDSIVEQLTCQADVITVAFSNTSTILTTAADRSSDAYVRGAPESDEIRGLLVRFGQIANEYGSKLSARTIVLAKVMNQDDFDAKKLPVSDYLRGSEATDYLQLFDWLEASMEASGHPRVGKLSVTERIRVAQRLAAGENWQKVNEVYASGQGEVGMAFIKDDLGNWNLKSFSSDPTELLAAYRNVTSAALKTAADLTAKAALGPAGSAGARLGDAARATQLATQLATGGAPATPGVVGGVNIAAMHQRTATQIASQRDRYVALEKQLLADVTAQDTALNTAKQKTAADKLTLANKQSALTTAETNRDEANDTLQTYLAVIRTKEAEGTVVEAQDRINATGARDTHTRLQRSANTAYGEVVAAQAVVDEDVAAEKALEAKKAAAAQRLADLPKDAIESLRGTLDQYAGVVADLQSGVAAASPAAPAPGRPGGALPALPQ